MEKSKIILSQLTNTLMRDMALNKVTAATTNVVERERLYREYGIA